MTDQHIPVVTPTKEQIEYWLALGIFVHQFAHIETTLWFLLAKLAGVNWPTARALFSGGHIEERRQSIGRLLDVTGATQAAKDDWQFVSAQLDHINKARNSILHYGTTFGEGDEFQSSNVLTARTEAHVRSFPVSREILNKMTNDLGTISAHLLAHLHGSAPPPRATWQYTPPPSRQTQPRKRAQKGGSRGARPTAQR